MMQQILSANCQEAALELEPLVLEAECIELNTIWKEHMDSHRSLIGLF